MVVVDGMPFTIKEVFVAVGAKFKNIIYRYMENDGTTIHEISEADLLIEIQHGT
jgi:hypothetical protein